MSNRSVLDMWNRAASKKTKDSTKKDSDSEPDSPMKKNANIKKGKKPVISSDSEPDSPVKQETPKKKTKKSVVVSSSDATEDDEGSPIKGRMSLKRSSESPDKKDASKPKIKKVDIKDFNPSMAKYHPILDAYWRKGEDVKYGALAKTLTEIENNSGRLKMIEILANFLSSCMILSPSDALPSVYLCLNKVAPDYEGVELGVGEATILKAIAEATGRPQKTLKTEMEKKGDIGLVAEASRSMQKTMFPRPPLTVKQVFDKMKTIATTGKNKGDFIKGLMVCCQENEAKFVARGLTGKLRIGLAEQSLLAALAKAAVYHEKIESEEDDIPEGEEYLKKVASIIKAAYCECPNYEKILHVILNDGIDALPQKCKITPGIPMKPMLAHPSRGVSEILKRFEDNAFTCEYKYDGERAQIHLLPDGTINIFSRNQENNTTKYPDIVSIIPQVKKEGVTSFIIDTEAVAWDREKEIILPFQILSTRKRKDVKEEDIKVRVCLFAFDILYLNGLPVNKLSLRERRQLLKDSFNETDGLFKFAQGGDVTSTDEIQEMVDKAVKDKCEGLMVKCLDKDAHYEIAKRSRNWLKLKKDYLEGVGDSLDLVVIGGWYGKGKRTGTFGGFLLACHDEENDEFQTICKIGTGFKDEDLEAHNKFLKGHTIPEPKSYYNWHENCKPDVWFDAVQVWEVLCADLSISPIHKASIGQVDESKGISLRFPRFIRIRDDKKPDMATSSSQVAEMYMNQDSVKNSGDQDAPSEDDD